MRDLTIAIMLLSLVGLAWRQPWIGLLGLIIVGILHPQNYATGFMRTIPAYSILLAIVLLGAARELYQQQKWRQIHWDWRLGLIALVWGWFALTTLYAINPLPARDKFLEVAKLLPPMLLVIVLIDSQEKIRWLLLAMALSITAIIVKGGYWAVMTGFQDRVYGPPNSAYGGNNEFAVVSAMAIPLLIYWYRSLPRAPVRWVVGGLIILSFATVLSSWSRGGILSLAAVALLSIMHSRKRWQGILLLLLGAGLILVALPDAWFARMQTLADPQQEESAVSRLLIWRLGWDYALQHPLLGSGFESWILFTPPDTEFRAWHSAYVQIAAEHGLAGLAWWAILLITTLVTLTRMTIRHGATATLTEQAMAVRTSLIAYMVGAAFLSIAYWELIYLLIAVAIVLQSRSRQQTK